MMNFVEMMHYCRNDEFCRHDELFVEMMNFALKVVEFMTTTMTFAGFVAGETGAFVHQKR